MKFTLIVPDATMAIDGVGHQIDVSAAPSGLHAVQWYDTWGEEEWKDDRGRMVRNQEISSYAPYQWAIDLWTQAEEAAQQPPPQTVSGDGTGPTVI